MPGANHDVSLAILRTCRDKGDAFYPRLDAGGLRVERHRLDAALDALRLGGFLEIADWIPDKGQGYRLTDVGRQAIDRPALLDRPPAPPHPAGPERSAETDWDRGESVRTSALAPRGPIVTPAIIGINILVFLGICADIWLQGGSVPNYLGGTSPFPGRGYLFPGSLFWPALTLLGQWWRLVSYMFVHGSVMHILFNMMALWNLAPAVEGRLGIVRFSILYLGAGVIGGIAALLLQPQTMGVDGRLVFVSTVGASGAVCGVFASLITIIYLHRRHLPPQFLQEVTRSFSYSIIIIVVISLMSGVSWSGHLGGAIGGALMTPPLEWLSRRAPLRNRILGVVMLLVIAATCFVLLEASPFARIDAFRLEP